MMSLSINTTGHLQSMGKCSIFRSVSIRVMDELANMTFSVRETEPSVKPTSHHLVGLTRFGRI